MNPLSLLTKGRTIRGIKERTGHYKLSDKSVLPNFSAPKITVPTTTHQEPEINRPPLQTALFEKAQPNPKMEMPVPAGVGSAAEAKPAPTALKVQPTEPARWIRWATLAADWVRQWMPGRRRSPSQIPTVQTELALDRVKVLRNDLIEDDLEVVTIDKKAGKKERPAQSEKAGHEQLTAHP